MPVPGKSVVICMMVFLFSACLLSAAAPPSRDYPVKPVPFTAVHLNDLFWAPRIETKNTHGTGCTFASAIAAGLAKSLPLPEAIAQAKAELVESLPPDGFAILNGDDPRVRQMATRTPATVFIYGQEHNFDLWAEEVSSHGLEGISLRLHYGWEAISLQVPLLGAQSVHTVLAAAAVGLIEGLTWEEIVSGLRNVPEQLRLLVVPGRNGATLIDDTYNSSPTSALAALNLLAEMPGRHLAVLGDMLELGSYEAEGHRLVGRRATEVTAVLVAVGSRGRLIGEEARAVGMSSEAVHFAADNAAAVALLQDLLQPGDFVLIKGSRGMAMEAIVNALCTD